MSCSRKWLFACALHVVFAAWGCAKTDRIKTETLPAKGFEVFFSIANQDPLAPFVTTDVLVNDAAVFHGAIPSSRGEEYCFVSTRVFEREFTIEARTEIDGELISAEKVVWAKPKMWVVITRLREIGARPKMQIDISYENHAYIRGER